MSADKLKLTVAEFIAALSPQLDLVGLRGTTIKATFPLDNDVYCFDITIVAVSKADIDEYQASLPVVPEQESN